MNLGLQILLPTNLKVYKSYGWLHSCYPLLSNQDVLTLLLLVILGVTDYDGLSLDDTPSARHHYVT